ncbi:MAG: hypothetical protein H6686_06770 [Fibrobacteria bacterium]|nr:hypothetical protein [Fibrobacteria bacterium]
MIGSVSSIGGSAPFPALERAQGPSVAPTLPPASLKLPPDRFQGSLRTPLDVDRRLATLGEGKSTPNFGDTEDPTRTKEQRVGLAAEASEGSEAADGEGKNAQGDTLDQEESQQVQELEKRDREVRAHEQAHLAAAAGLARGGANFSYETGPDGKRYAVGGEVSISMRTGKTPEETIRNARQVQSAALAPANPSAVDLQTAAAAARMEQEARRQIVAGEGEGGSEGEGEGSKPAAPGSGTTSPTEPSSPRRSPGRSASETVTETSPGIGPQERRNGLSANPTDSPLTPLPGFPPFGPTRSAGTFR